jgi:hypothetical protein
VSGSNCCAPGKVHVFLHKPDGTFAPRREIQFRLPGQTSLSRGLSRPQLLDWDRDGQTDLVVTYPGEWTFYTVVGPLAGKAEVRVEAFRVPSPLKASPVHFAFVDWDGDGAFDLLVAVDQEKGKKEDGRSRYEGSIQ